MSASAVAGSCRFGAGIRKFLPRLPTREPQHIIDPERARALREARRNLSRGSIAHPVRQLVLVGEVRETGDLGLEGELDGAGRAVALLADDDLGAPMGLVHVRL